MHTSEAGFPRVPANTRPHSSLVHVQDLPGGGGRLTPEDCHPNHSSRRRARRAQGSQQQRFQQSEDLVQRMPNCQTAVYFVADRPLCHAGLGQYRCFTDIFMFCCRNLRVEVRLRQQRQQILRRRGMRRRSSRPLKLKVRQGLRPLRATRQLQSGLILNMRAACWHDKSHRPPFPTVRQSPLSQSMSQKRRYNAVMRATHGHDEVYMPLLFFGRAP